MNSSNKDRNIAILHFASPPIVGGVESTIYHHARMLNDLGYKVSVITGKGEKFLPDVELFLFPELDSRNDRVQAVGKELAQGEVSKDFDLLSAKIESNLKPILEDQLVCIVHNAMSLHFNLPLTAALKNLCDQKSTRFIAWNHDFAWHDKLYIPDLHEGYPWKLLKQPWNGVKYVVVSEHRKGRLAELLGISDRQIEVVTPGVDVSQFLNLDDLTQELVDNLDLGSADPFMLLPARIIPRKNIQFALEATALIVKKKPNAALVITGPPGPHNPKNIRYLQSLQDICDVNGLDKNVLFLYKQGFDGQPLYIPDRVVADLYRLADLLFFPPFREGFGIPILEAGLVKLPVFASDIPPIRESGVEFINVFNPYGDPSIAANQIVDYVNSDERYHLRRRVLDQFSWQAIVKNRIIPMFNEDSYE